MRKKRGVAIDEQDIRWKQRLANFNTALSQLKKFIDRGELNEFEEQGLVQACEYTDELAWNMVRDYLREQGNQDIHDSSEAIREGLNLGMIADERGLDRNAQGSQFERRF